MARTILAAGLTVWLLVWAVTGLAAEAKQPTWAELTPQQQAVLAPLSREWDSEPDKFRKKMLGVAKRYPKMTPQQQERVQKRLDGWGKLTAEQRDRARKKYQNLKQLPPEKRQDVKKKWQEYQQLPEEERAKLRAAKTAKKTTPPAATPAQSLAPAKPPAR